MSRKYLSVTETAKIIRQCLKESFPGVKFSVKSSSYSGGASIRVGWTDGPNNAQVEAITNRFRAAYFDGMIDYQGSIYAMMNGEQVRFGADYISTVRSYTVQATEQAIARVYRRFAGNFKHDGLECPTVEQYERGELNSVQLSGLHHYYSESVQTEINRALHKTTFQPRTQDSKTAGTIFVTHDDGYSAACGSGFRAVAVE